MKKFLALLVTVAMLLVAGSAMAAEPTLTLSPTRATVQAGATTPVTATARAGHTGGTMGAITVTGTGAEWAFVKGSTITLTPGKTVTAGSYTLTVSSVETYTETTAAGHIVSRTATATATLNVIVTAASAGTTIAVKTVDTVTKVTETVAVVSTNAQGSTVVDTFEDTVKTVAQTVTVAVLIQVDGYDEELAIEWEGKKEEVEAKTQDIINIIVNFQKEVFGNLPAGTTLTKRDSSGLEKSSSSKITSDMTVTQKLAAATAELIRRISATLSGSSNSVSAAADDTPTVISVSEAVTARESGTYSFHKTFGKELWGLSIYGYNGQRELVGESVAPVDGRGVAFLNSSGDIVTAIPDGSKSQDIMPGFVTMLVVMEAGRTYEPVVYTTGKDLTDKGISTSQTTVTYNEIKEEKKTVVVTVDENGNVTETVIETASADVVNKMATAMGSSSIVMVPTSALEEVTEATVTKDDSAAAAASVHVAVRMPAFKNLSNGTYYFPVTFKSLGVGVTAGSAFDFYPDGYSAGTTAFAMVFDDKGNEITNPASVLSATSSDVKGFIAFEIENGGIRVADADNTLANPMLGVAITPVTPTPTPTSDDAVLAELVTKGYINSSRTILDAGFDGGKPSLSDYTAKTIKLNFDVDPTSWTIAVAGNGSIKASAIGTITNATARQATVQLTKSQITAGTHAVTLTVLPVSGTTKAANTVSASLGNVEGNPGLVGVGSSSGGCSAGSAVLALALLGTFIASRKK